MAINYNNDPYNQGLGNLNTGIMQTAGIIPEFMGGTSDEEDAAQEAAQNSLEQIQGLRQQENAIKSMGEGAIELKQDELKSIQNQIQDIKNQNKDFQQFKDIGGLTANANNIMSDANYGYSDVPELSSGIMGMLNKQQNYEPQYSIRDQLNRDFLQGGLFRDGINSLQQTGTALNEDFGSIKGTIGSGINNLKTGIFNNPVTRGLGTAFNFAKGNIPGMLMSGIGALFNRDPNAPSYQTRSPNINYSNLNTNNLNDFYDNNPNSSTFGTTRFDRAKPGSFGSFRTLADYFNRDTNISNPTDAINSQNKAVDKQGLGPGPGAGNSGANDGPSGVGGGYNEGNFCFDPSTPIQMADGSTKEIKNIQLGDDTKGGEVTGVFQFKASDEIHDYKGVTVAGSHYVKEDGKFIMVKDSPLSVKIDKIPVVYSLDTTGRRIFINDIEFADYNGDGVAKSFLSNAGVNLFGFDKEVLRQVEQRLI